MFSTCLIFDLFDVYYLVFTVSIGGALKRFVLEVFTMSMSMDVDASRVYYSK